MFSTDEKEMKETKPLEKIQLKHLIIPFLILGVGCFIALVVFLIEMMSKKQVHESQHAKDRGNQNMETFSSDLLRTTQNQSNWQQNSS